MGKSEISAEQLTEHPLLAVLILLVTSVGFVLLVGAIATWTWMGLRVKRGETILPIEPWRPRVWGLLDLVFVFMTVIVFQVVSIQLARSLLGMQVGPDFSEEQLPLSAMAFLGAGNLAAVLVVTSWIVFRHQASLDHLGFRFRTLNRQLTLGIFAAFASLPVVYLLMIVVSQGMNSEYDHPLITKMLEGATLSSFLIGTFSAVIAAPLSEEFMFRVILQGWLQSIGSRWAGQAWFWGAAQGAEQPAGIMTHGDSIDSPASPPVAELRVFQDDERADFDSGNVFENFSAEQNSPLKPGGASPESDMNEPIMASIVEDSASSAVEVKMIPPLWPVFVSGVLFGLAHWGYGLSFVPLIALGIVLGLLYRATHSIWPGLVVHLSLNLLSMLALALTIVMKQAGIEP